MRHKRGVKQSPGARVGTAGAAAPNEPARKCWRWPARSPGDGDGPDTAPCTWQSSVPPSRQGPYLGCLGEAAAPGPRSRARMPEAEVEHEILSPLTDVAR